MNQKTIKALKNCAFVLVIIASLSACKRNEIYSNFIGIETPCWHADSVIAYEFELDDVERTYQMTINMRHRGNYPYQNMWLFVKQIAPDSTIVSDTIEFYLADNRGKWLGKGIGAVYTMPVLLHSNYKFEKQGLYRIELQHGMREIELYGVNDLGLVVEMQNSNGSPSLNSNSDTDSINNSN